jgi:hypothetical protein
MPRLEKSDTIPVYSENHREHQNTPRGPNEETLVLNLEVNMVTTKLKRVKRLYVECCFT